MAGQRDAEPPEGAPQARDVMAFGQEVGRVLSDGRIVGRAEPFAKVFPSSRAVKRVVGLTAWAVLEDIALDAQLDDRGRLVAETNVRRIATNLAVSKNTVAHHLGRLRAFGLCVLEEIRGDGSGRYEVSRYILDPSACVERFTTTPTTAAPTPIQGQGQTRDAASVVAEPVQPCGPADAPESPCPRSWYTDGTVSQSTGSQELGHKNKTVVEPEEQQHGPAADTNPSRDEVCERLVALGVTADSAEALSCRHPPALVAAAVRAASSRDLRNPAGFAVSALRDGWDLSAVLADQHAEQTRRRRRMEQEAHAAATRAAEGRARARADGWSAAVSAALNDEDFARAVVEVTEPLAGLGRRSVPVARAQLIGWAARVACRSPGQALRDALRANLAGVSRPASASHGGLPEPPQSAGDATDLTGRLSACLQERVLDCPTTEQPAERGAEP